MKRKTIFLVYISHSSTLLPQLRSVILQYDRLNVLTASSFNSQLNVKKMTVLAEFEPGSSGMGVYYVYYY